MKTSTPTIDSPAHTLSKQKKKVRRSKAQWKALLDELASSGMTKSAFCQKHRIAPSNLYRWQKLLAEESTPGDFIEITEPLVETEPAPSAAFNDSPWQVELALGAGVVLRVRTH